MQTTRSTVGQKPVPTAVKAKAPAKAKAKAPNADAVAADSSTGSTPTKSKKDLDQFGDRLRRAPSEIQSAWKVAKSTKDGDYRDRLFELIKNTKKGDFSQCQLLISEHLERESGVY